jgi:methylenetetrahydrofolate reductase (NADPH)
MTVRSPEVAGVGALLSRPRFELVPLRGAEEEAGHLPAGATVTVTCSPRKGLDATVSLAGTLAGRGFRAVPHLAARLVRGPGHLHRLVEELHRAGVEEVFVIGGDPSEPVGPYGSAGSLLAAMAEADHPFRQIGVAGYPERHPLIETEELDRCLLEKQPSAGYLVTQICFDPPTIFRWLRRIRAAGVHLPAYLGVPGAVSRRKLLEIALRIGVGDSLRYLTKHGSLVARLIGRGSCRPDGFLARVGPHLPEPGHGVVGLHLNTFNQVRTTERWRQRALADYRWSRPEEPDETGFAS